MFYCESCEKRRKWPPSFFKSYERCEVCKKVAYCSDVPSWALPLPPPKKKEAQ